MRHFFYCMIIINYRSNQGFLLVCVLVRLRSSDISEEELCLLMGEFVSAAQKGDHQAQGWPNSAYGTTKVTSIQLSHMQKFVNSLILDLLFNKQTRNNQVMCGML